MIIDNDKLIKMLQENTNEESQPDILFNLICNNIHKDNVSVIDYCNQLIDNYGNVYDEKRIEIATYIIENIDLDQGILVDIGYRIGSLFERTDFNYANSMYQQSLLIAEELEDQIRIARGLNYVSFILNKKGRYDKSSELINRSLAIGEKYDDYLVQTKGNSLLAEMYLNKGELDKALDHYLKTLSLYEKHEDLLGISQSYNNIGLVYYRILNYEKALAYFEKAKIAKEELKDIRGLSFTYNNLGAVAFATKDFDNALEYYKKSLEIKKDLDDVYGQLSVVSNIGGVYYHYSQPEEALKWFQEAYDLTMKLGDKHHAALILGNMSNVNLELKHYEKSLELAGMELAIAQEIEELPLQQSAYAAYYLIYKQMGDYKKSLEHYIQYKKLSDEIYRNNSDKKIAELQTQYDLEKKERENEIYRLKNVELAMANETINEKNQQLESIKKDLILINKILRHDLMNNLSVIDAALNIYISEREENVLNEAKLYVQKSFELILKMRDTELLDYREVLHKINVVNVIQSVMINHHKLEFDIHGEGSVIANDYLNSVIDNIVCNAKKHGAATTISFVLNEEDKYFRLEIINNGIMINREHLKKIFEEGFSSGPSGNTGIGLFIAKKTLQNLGGDISITENQNGRVIFELVIPINNDAKHESISQ